MWSSSFIWERFWNTHIKINNTPHSYDDQCLAAGYTNPSDYVFAYPLMFEIFQISPKDKSDTLSSNMSVLLTKFGC